MCSAKNKSSNYLILNISCGNCDGFPKRTCGSWKNTFCMCCIFYVCVDACDGKKVQIKRKVNKNGQKQINTQKINSLIGQQQYKKGNKGRSF